MESSHDQKESIRDLAALVRTAGEATARAAELLYQWKAPEDAEIQNLRAVAGELLLKNVEIARLASEGRFELAMVKSRALKLHCDAAASLRPLGQLRAMLQAKKLHGDPVSRLPELTVPPGGVFAAACKGTLEQRRSNLIVEAQQYLRFRPETGLSEEAVKGFMLKYPELPAEILYQLLAIERERVAGDEDVPPLPTN